MYLVEFDGYKVRLNNWFGDYEDCVVGFDITHPDGKSIKDTRYGHASKKGIFKTSIYGVPLKVNLETKEIELV